MTNLIVIKRIALNERPLRPGRTEHSFNGKEFPPFVALAIGQYSGEIGYYVMHICEDGRAADTRHKNVDDALHQAEYEFGVKPQEWTETDDRVP